jgi:hypothetical protein
MNDDERFEYINEELKAVISEFTPRLNELIYMNECLKDLERVSRGESPKHTNN